MDHRTIFFVILAILGFDFILSRVLEYLNKTRFKAKLPPEVDDVFDQQEYNKSQDYKIENYRFSTFQAMLSFVLIMGMFIFEGFAYVDGIARSFTGNPILVALVFFGILMLASDIISTPFSWYDTFVIEEKYGFNKTTPKTFFLDKLKSWLLGIIIGGGLMALVIWIYQMTTDMFWIYGWITVSGFTLFMGMFYSNLIVPLFNKQTPLEEGELKDEINQFAEKAGFQLKNIYVIDGSKRSTKANAYFTGMGPKKRIVLYDTLINDLDKQEITAVLAHEIGHYKKKHTLVGIMISIIHTGVLFYLLSLFIGNPELSKALGVDEPSFHISIITFGILYSPISTILGLGMNVMSRKNEYTADRFASVTYNGEKLISALKGLSRKALGNLTPHKAYVFFNYSHPPLLERIRAIRNGK